MKHKSMKIIALLLVLSLLVSPLSNVKIYAAEPDHMEENGNTLDEKKEPAKESSAAPEEKKEPVKESSAAPEEKKEPVKEESSAASEEKKEPAKESSAAESTEARKESEAENSAAVSSEANAETKENSDVSVPEESSTAANTEESSAAETQAAPENTETTAAAQTGKAPAGEVVSGEQASDVVQAVEEAVLLAAEGEQPVKPTAAIGGVTVVKNDGGSYGMFPITDAVCTVNGDVIEISFKTGAKKTFDRLYLGYQSDEDKSGYFTGNNTGSTCEFTIRVPLSSANSWIPVAVGRSDTEAWSENYLWMSIPRVLVITKQPEAASKKAGETVSLSVEAEGDGLTYQWQYSSDGSSWADCADGSANSAAYSFVLAADLSGQYRCVVRDGMGAEAVTNAVKVSTVSEQEGFLADDGITAIYGSDDAKKPGQVYTMFKIAASKAVIRGDGIEVTIWVSPASSGNFSYDAIYIGKKDDNPKEPIVLGEVDTDKNLQKFHFTVPFSASGGEVHFVPRSASKGTWSTSSSLALKIPALSDFTKPAEITITTQPEKEIVTNAGAEVVLSVVATDDGGTALSYQWQYSIDGTAWTDCTGDSAKTSEYRFVMAADLAGQYRCVITGGAGTTATSTAATVREASAPVVTGSAVKVVKDNGAEFAMFKIGESTVMAEGDELEITISTANTSFDKLYLGYKDDASKTPVIAGAQLASGGWTFTFRLPISDKGKVLPVCLGYPEGNAKDWYTNQQLWIYIPDEAKDLPTETDSIQAIAGGTGAAYNNFTIVSSKAVLKGDEVILTLQVKGNKWTKLYQGLQADANKTATCTGSYDDQADRTIFTFRVPAEKQGMNIPVTPGNASGWFQYARDLFINVPNLEGKANTTAGGTYELYGSAYPVSSYTSLSFERGSSVTIDGGTATVTMVTQAKDYDKLYIGQAGDADSVKNAKAVNAVPRTDIGDTYKSFTFTIPASDLGKEVSYVVHIEKTNTWAEKSGSFYINGILEKTGDLPAPDPDPTDPTVPADGSYKVTVDSSASMFRVVNCVLTVKNGKMSAVLTLSGTGYDYLYVGTAEAAAKADKSAWAPFVKDTEGKYTYTIPVESLDKEIPVAAHSIKNDKWYDRTLTFRSEGMEPVEPVIANGIYTIEVDSSAAMFRVVNCVLTVKNGTMSAVLTLSGTGYDYLYVGTAKDAANADKSAFAPFVKDAGGKYTYTIPVAALDQEIPVAAHSIKNDRWYDRTLTFRSETMQKIGDVEGGGEQPVPPVNPDDGKENENDNNQTDVIPDNDGKADNESKYESDTSGSTGRVDSATTLADGVYKPDKFSWSGGTGRVRISCNKITVKNGQAYATLVFSSDSYEYVKANGNTYYTSKGGGTSTVVIPVALNKNNRILGMTSKMTASHEIEYTIFIYLAAAESGQAAGENSNEKLDETAPNIIGLEYQSETKLDYAEYFKIYHYDQDIVLLEIDMTKDTARDPAKLAEKAGEQADTEKDAAKEETKTDAGAAAAEDGEELVPNENEIAAELYKGNVVKYLLVPENTEIPVGLEQDMIVVRMPVDHTYAASDDILKTMETLGILDNLVAVGCEQQDCTIDSIAEKMTAKDGEQEAEVIFGGLFDQPDYKALIKKEVNLAILPAGLLPREEEAGAEDGQETAGTAEPKDSKTSPEAAAKQNAGEAGAAAGAEKLTVEEQTERFEELTGNLAMFGIPVILDRSADEKTDLGKLEWIKVYGVLFGCEEKTDQLYETAVKEAAQQENRS